MLDRLVDRFPSEEIADQLVVAEVTIRTPRSNGYRRLDARARGESCGWFRISSEARVTLLTGPPSARRWAPHGRVGDALGMARQSVAAILWGGVNDRFELAGCLGTSAGCGLSE